LIIFSCKTRTGRAGFDTCTGFSNWRLTDYQSHSHLSHSVQCFVPLTHAAAPPYSLVKIPLHVNSFQNRRGVQDLNLLPILHFHLSVTHSSP